MVEIVQNEGSFNVDKIESFELNWDPEDNPWNKDFVFNKQKSGQSVANCVRAFTEPCLQAIFGDTIIEKLFSRYAHHVAEHLAIEKTKERVECHILHSYIHNGGQITMKCHVFMQITTSRLAAASVSLPSSDGLGEESQMAVIPLLCAIFLANQGEEDVAGEVLPWVMRTPQYDTLAPILLLPFYNIILL
ncbi:SAM dependent carboxyl methyltransferase [Corchorus olitorius]|uniref:SAM dependent carboxyl methyltransferase n=1 Tax=Corchorus olitorius TaxID=93759 RepID=A0A1R3KGL2_9ROSI|nr:SAM dependent carboxyl methyltransferase [Corchorus olitorius]